MLLPAPLSRYVASLRSLSRMHANRAARRRDETNDSLSARLLDVVLRTWDLGFTAFGGPPVHFRIFHRRFVEGLGGKEKWVDEQTYQELFAICQGLPGPGSTKMLFCLTLLHAGFIPALVVFMIWSLPGAIGMYALSLGVQNIGQSLPLPVYALLSGLNASTVGIIALAAVQLGDKAIRDRLTRILVIFGACAGLCYNALWYFPTLMVIGGSATVIWDGWMAQRVRKLKTRWEQRHERQVEAEVEVEAGPAGGQNIPLEERNAAASQPETTDAPGQPGEDSTMRSRKTGPSSETLSQNTAEVAESTPREHSVVADNNVQSQPRKDHIISIRTGINITILFFASFIAVLVARGVLHPAPLALNLFANMYLAGTIIFGGGPVVIPLLRSYVVDPGWVSGRDFLIGLALIQAFPGPNFNFAVFLGALALQQSRFPTIFGAFLGGLGIFFPGITLAVAVQSFWGVLRKRKWVIDFLRGVNATAVGLVFTAVYRLWEIGYLTPKASSGQSLAKDPWWVVVAALTYAESAWFDVPPAAAIVFGAILGLIWYGVVGVKHAAIA